MKTLYRPVGLAEMKLILDADLKAFPPRLPEQPIFYPVLNKTYADKIASDWNTKDRFSGFVGFVTEFDVQSPFIDRFEAQIVGSTVHEELWIPSEDLEEMNDNIAGRIKLIDAFYGKPYTGLTPESTVFDGQSPAEQFKTWCAIYNHNPMDFYGEIREHWIYIYMNYAYWTELDHAAAGVSEAEKKEVMLKMNEYWTEQFADIPLLSKSGKGASL
ncbi:hypothetical protein QWJ34_12510 [Saccharibacillus sp. CPCC 101409]|uniref:hypothetical protein n=1 Tax=Saccharibacillus sp. CPCC 101409 TaxID=3058041 RepID=UPI002673C88E|nr:hypothetical protein [Saccharibacillus sp. CPCC 101409]MDO3410586.1 hypothetical protein [Saccharibacillus sp. CPCC 101409]